MSMEAQRELVDTDGKLTAESVEENWVYPTINA
jgi:hypothetical protein